MRAKPMPVMFLLAMLAVAGCDGMEDEDQEEAEDTANIVPGSGTANPL